MFSISNLLKLYANPASASFRLSMASLLIRRFSAARCCISLRGQRLRVHTVLWNGLASQNIPHKQVVQVVHRFRNDLGDGRRHELEDSRSLVLPSRFAPSICDFGKLNKVCSVRTDPPSLVLCSVRGEVAGGWSPCNPKEITGRVSPFGVTSWPLW